MRSFFADVHRRQYVIDDVGEPVYGLWFILRKVCEGAGMPIGNDYGTALLTWSALPIIGALTRYRGERPANPAGFWALWATGLLLLLGPMLLLWCRERWGWRTRLTELAERTEEGWGCAIALSGLLLCGAAVVLVP